MPGNEEIWYLLVLAQTQWRATDGGYYGLDFNVLIQMARGLGIQTGQIFFEKLRVYEREALKIFRQKKEDICDEKQKESCKLEFGEFFEWACGKCEKNPNKKDELNAAE